MHGPFSPRRRVSTAALAAAAVASLAAGLARADGDAADGLESGTGSPTAGSEAAKAHVATPIDRALLVAYLADNGTFTLIDARSEDEYGVGHILGAVNVPHDAVEAFAAALPDDRDVPLVVYCKTGKRAALAAERLSARGYTNVRVLGAEQIFWSDTAPMFNCGVPASRDPASGAASPAVSQPMITVEN